MDGITVLLCGKVDGETLTKSTAMTMATTNRTILSR